MAAGLINTSDVELHLNEEIASISYLGDYYELNSTNGNSYTCDISVVATPLDEINIRFTPAFLIPNRKLHHTHATFVRGFLNPVSILTVTSNIQKFITRMLSYAVFPLLYIIFQYSNY
ncbi:hypothetical protein CsSME_00019949 [Camellia sinensis var. sinensis]